MKTARRLSPLPLLLILALLPPFPWIYKIVFFIILSSQSAAGRPA